MNDQSSTTTNTQSEPQLCKMGCGFFGSNATGDCCSKCWTNLQKQQQKGNTTDTKTQTQQPQPQPMEISTPVSTPVQLESELSAAATEEPVVTVDAPVEKPKKKKKKKTSYKAMMANMTKCNKTEDAIQKEKDNLRKVTGGGAFSKIDKI